MEFPTSSFAPWSEAQCHLPHFRDWLKELFAWLKRFQLWSWAFCSSSILWGLGQFLGQFSALPFFRSSCQVPEGDLLSCFAAQLL